MKWCLWCGERLRRNIFKSYNGWVHQNGSIYKTFVGANGQVLDDHCVLPTDDQEAAQRMAAERTKERMR